MNWVMTFDLTDVIRIAIYIWALFELGLLAYLYRYAYSKSNGSKVIKTLFLFLVAITIEVLYRFLWSYSLYLSENEGLHALFRQLRSIPLILVVYSAKRFRDASLEPDHKELEKTLKQESDIIKKSKK